MATPVQIANAAVSKLGDVPISALPPREWTLPEVTDPTFADEAARFSEAAQMCGATYYIHRDALLAKNPWSFALRRTKLEPRQSDVPHRYEYLFYLPSPERDLGIGLRGVYTSERSTRPLVDGWVREADGISSFWRELWAEWIADVPEEQWPPAVVNALVLRLCSEWAYYFTDQANLTEYYDGLAEDAFRMATRLDGQAKPSEGTMDFPLIDARYQGGNNSRAFRTG